MDALTLSSASVVGFEQREELVEEEEEEDGDARASAKRFEGVLSDFVYSACYCEENVYMLCKKLSEVGLAAPDASDLFVVFISNPIRQIPIWRQRNSKDVEGLCIWDYHVICIQRDQRKGSVVQVWDLDTTLPCPATLDEYAAGAFQPWVSLKPEFSSFAQTIVREISDDASFRIPVCRKGSKSRTCVVNGASISGPWLYRIVAAPLYLRFFASDRRHMKKKDGSWMAPPPLYDCHIAEDGAVHNLEEFITMSIEHVERVSRQTESLLEVQKFGVILDETGLLQLLKQNAH